MLSYVNKVYLLKSDNRYRDYKENIMTVNDVFRLIVGVMILVSLLLTQYHSPNWVWFTAFIGFNLLQSAFSKWCLMMIVLKKIGLKDSYTECR